MEPIRPERDEYVDRVAEMHDEPTAANDLIAPEPTGDPSSSVSFPERDVIAVAALALGVIALILGIALVSVAAAIIIFGAVALVAAAILFGFYDPSSTKEQ